MATGVRVFVLLVFAALAISFIATTATLAKEFWQQDLWLDFLTRDSHLFLFFPIGGIIALAAFYLPSCAFVDLYWNHLKFGRIRFILGLLMVLAASWTVAALILNGQNKAVWITDPETLVADRGEPANCLKNGDCDRLPIVKVIKNLRDVSKTRQSLGPLVRTCKKDPLIETASNNTAKRYCLVTTPFSARPELKTDEECCRGQAAYLKAVRDLQATDLPKKDFIAGLATPLKLFTVDQERTNLSQTGLVHGLLLPLKVMFLLMLLSISILITIHFGKIEKYYRPYLSSIESGLLIGTFAVLFFPLMSQAFLQSVDAMVGDLGRGNFSNIVPVMSFLFGIWTLLILLYFYRRGDKEAEALAKIGGAATGIVALLQYQTIIDFLVSTVGSGADWYVIVAFALIAPIVVFIILSFLVSSDSNTETEKTDA